MTSNINGGVWGNLLMSGKWGWTEIQLMDIGVRGDELRPGSTEDN